MGNKLTTIFMLLFCSMLLTMCNKKETQQVPIGEVKRGALYLDLYEEGEVEAIQSTDITAPRISWRYGNLKITEMIKDGQEVQAGDTLIVFDPSEVLKGIIDAESSLEIAEAEYERMIAQQQSDLEDLKAGLEVTRISHEISKIRFESSVYESDIRKKEIQLNLDKAEIALQRSKEQMENRIKIQNEEAKQKRLSINRYISNLEEARDALTQLYVISPSSGIAIVERNRSNNNKFQIGDQTWAGQPIIQLPDLSSLKATVQINEVDIAKISKDLEVEIKPDAFSDSIFSGNVKTIANLAVNKERSSKIKVFPVEIILNETDKNLLPGLTVSCRIILDKIDDVLYIPLDALQIEEDKSYVYKKKGNSFNKVEIETGKSNTDYIIVSNGLKENDKIALVNPFAEETEVEQPENMTL